MRNVLALLTVAGMLAFATSAALANGPSVNGTVDQKFSAFGGNNAQTLIDVDGTPYAVPLSVYDSVHIGDTVQFDGMNWSIVK